MSEATPNTEADEKLQFESAEELIAYVKQLRKRNKFKPLFSSDKSDWETPQWLFDAVNHEFQFTLDAAASWENKKCKNFYSIHQDAFRLRWPGTVWLNPPYSTGIDRWIAKAKKSAEEDGATVVCLVPSRTDTNWWFDHARFSEVRFLKGRLKFVGGPSSAPFPSALLIFGPELRRSTSYWNYDWAPEPLKWVAQRLG